MICQFVIRDGLATCSVCGKTYKTNQTDPAKIRAICLEKVGRVTVAQIKAANSCKFRGEQLRSEMCPTCGGKSKPIPVLSCAVHGECVLRAISSKPSLKSCSGCTERVPGESKKP